jgi:hypothetical protein
MFVASCTCGLRRSVFRISTRKMTKFDTKQQLMFVAGCPFGLGRSVFRISTRKMTKFDTKQQLMIHDLTRI